MRMNNGRETKGADPLDKSKDIAKRLGNHSGLLLCAQHCVGLPRCRLAVGEDITYRKKLKE